MEYIVFSTSFPATTENTIFIGTLSELSDKFSTELGNVSLVSARKLAKKHSWSFFVQRHQFVIGDGVSIGYGSDSYPATVVDTTKGSVRVQTDDCFCIKPETSYGSGDSEFIYSRNPEGSIQTFTVRKNGRLYPKGGSNKYGSLGAGRLYYRDPHF